MPRGILGRPAAEVQPAPDHLADGADPRDRRCDQALRRRRRGQPRVACARARAHLRAHRPQRLGQDHALQLHHRGRARSTRARSASRASASTASSPHQIFHLGMGRTFQVIRVFPELTALENLLVVTTARARGGASARARELLALRQARAPRRRVRGQPLLRPAEARGVRARAHDRSRADPARRAGRGGQPDPAQRAARRGAAACATQGKTVLLVEHDMKVVMGLCETVFVLDHGEKLAEGPPGADPGRRAGH